MQTYILRLSDAQEKEAMEKVGVKTRKELAHFFGATRIISAGFKTWECMIIDTMSDEADATPMTWTEVWHYVRAYLNAPRNFDNKSLLSRLTSVLMKACTCRLKPSQVSWSGKS